MDTQEPIKLKSVVLNNIRRFGPDVEIKFGAGATILIAPNGFGKTAVLEAIELALTAGVKRLSGRWTPLIREGVNDASVQLNFGAWQREVSLTKNSVNVVNEGRLREIFNDINPDEIPFLLRLTHLLDQRDSDWLCQQRSEAAGGQLAMLPLGRQASQVNSTVARLKPAVSKQLNELIKSIAEKQKVLDEWNQLVLARDSARLDLSKPLTPLSVLAETLVQMTSLPIPQGLNNVAAIREQWAIVSTANNQSLALMEASLNNLAGLVLVPATYLEIAESLLRRQLELQTEKANQAAHQATGTALSDRILAAEASHRELVSKVAQSKLVLDRKREHAKTVALLEMHRQKREEQVLSREQKKSAFDATQQIHNAALTAKDVNAMLDALAGAIALKRSGIAAAKQSYADWQGAESRKRVEEQNLQARNAEIESCHENLRITVAELEQAALEHQSARSILAVYQEAAGAIRAAVSIVAENLPIGTDKCPVCLEPHGEQMLRRRIADALNAMDPRLSEATAALRLAAEKLEAAQKSKDVTNAALTTTHTVRSRVNEAIAAIESEIKIARGNSFLVGLELAEVQKRLDSLQAEVDSDSSELNSKSSSQEPPLSVEAMAQLTARFNSEKRELAEFEEALARLDETINDTKAALAEFSLLVTGDVTIEEVERALSSLENEVLGSAAGIENEQAKKSALTRTLLDVDAAISRITQQLELDQARLETQRSKWELAGLVVPPSDEQLRTIKEELLEDKAKAEAAKAKLNDIETELSRIAEANALANAQHTVDAARGDKTEGEHTQILMAELKSVQDEHTLGTERKSALDEFHTHLTNGIEKIRDRIGDVVPYWQAILRRVVQEPRFSGTNLDYYKNRAKNHAAIQVGLGGELVGVADVASQAQMTDLQLSFMLAMATVHQWSPWKALLLDDPTQHHDLVHASSVFDVLRDFIAEHGFQVVLTTHDAQQARFLMRKLSNDGLDARLWKLEPSQDGMTAMQIGGRD
ncbi:AAA family ATPase [Massilia sp. PWRC2]|uniref:AAA family ATPase n=1 Tax=Massilia sp. PWRC2 TaxID=2804626 RepID=UPI003CF08D77